MYDLDAIDVLVHDQLVHQYDDDDDDDDDADED
jgi:hypothetical protein